MLCRGRFRYSPKTSRPESLLRGEEYEASGELQVEGVDLLGADVTGEQGDFAGAETGPRARTERVAIEPNFLQVNHLFHFGVTDAETKVARIAVQEGVEIHRGTIWRPSQVAKRIQAGPEFAPLLVLHLVKHELVVACGGDRQNVAAVRRPSRGEYPFGIRYLRSLPRSHVDQLDKSLVRMNNVVMADGDRVSVLGPGGIGFLSIRVSQRLGIATIF